MDSTTLGALVAPEDSSGSREASGSCLKVDECSVLVFTPRKCLHRTPSNSRPGAIAEEKKVGQDSCYTPSKTLQSTLPRSGRGSDERDGERPGGVKGIKRPRSNSPSASQSETGTRVDLPASNKALKHLVSVHDCDSEGAKRGVQAYCFSPKKALLKSLPLTAVPGFEVGVEMCAICVGCGMAVAIMAGGRGFVSLMWLPCFSWVLQNGN